jgi:hypothetical protein
MLTVEKKREEKAENQTREECPVPPHQFVESIHPESFPPSVGLKPILFPAGRLSRVPQVEIRGIHFKARPIIKVNELKTGPNCFFTAKKA